MIDTDNGDGDGFDSIMKRHQQKNAKRTAERAAKIEQVRVSQLLASAWSAMDDHNPLWKWTDESTHNLLKLAELIQHHGDIEVVRKVGDRIEKWLSKPDPLKYHYPVDYLKPGNATKQQKIEFMEGMLVCSRLLLAAHRGDLSEIQRLTELDELVRPVHWERLGHEVERNPDMPLEPVLLGPRQLYCGNCSKHYPLADDHTGPVMCPVCSTKPQTVVDSGDDAVQVDHVTLRQCAAIIQKGKRTLENWKRDDPEFPCANVIGGIGKADEWLWSEIRPYLERKSKRPLPATFPGHLTG